MDAGLFVYRGGLRSTVQKLADGKEHTLYYKARTPDEIAVFVGANKRFPDDSKGDLARQAHRAKFIADSLCNEDGTPLLTLEQAALIPVTLKLELCELVVIGSNETENTGNA